MRFWSRSSRGLGALVLVVVFAALWGGCGDVGDADSPDDNPQVLVSASNQDADKRVPPLVAQLKAATDGLLFMSESDYPFEVLYWTRPGGMITAERIAELTGHAGEVVEERSIDDFFRGATTIYDGQTAQEIATVERYRQLVKLLRRRLSFPRVYRFGAIQIHGVVVGVTNAGAWAGLSTIQIET
jgi:hypothetical protein